MKRQIPYSIEAEQAVIGGLLQVNDARYDVAAVVSTNDFYNADHRLIFSAITELNNDGKPYDVITLAEYLNSRSELDKVGGAHYLAVLAEATTTSNIISYATIVRERSVLRALIATAGRTIETAHNTGGKSSDEIIAEHQAELDRIRTRRHGHDTDWQTATRKGMELLSEIEGLRDKDGTLGISTGLPKLDDCLTGIYGPRLFIVAGRPSLGKTAFTQQVVINAARQGHKIGICSLEMGTDELVIRSMSYRCEIDLSLLMRGEENAVVSASKQFDKLKGLNIWIDASTYSLNGIVARITQWRRDHDIEFAVIDHIGLIEADGYNNRNDQLGHVSRTIKKLCKQLDMPIMIVSQLNRAVERENRRPRLADLRDSGSIEQDADVVIMLHRCSDDDSGETVPMEFGLLKNRCGRKGWISGYVFRGAFQRFEEMIKLNSAA